MSPVPKKEIINELRAIVAGHVNGKTAARKLGVTPSVLSLTLNNHYPVIPARILRKLGYKTEIVYVQGKKNVPATDLPVAIVATPLHPTPFTMDDIIPPPAAPEIFINMRDED
ncbi:MAG: hypothetical protein M3R16_03660 [Pseudomonadota bacterium]|nr:hypothetical protein [Pseudomonadota bacterium]